MDRRASTPRQLASHRNLLTSTIAPDDECVFNTLTNPDNVRKALTPPPASRDNHESQDYSNLVSLMHKTCPQEIIDHIQYWLFEILFCPGHLFTSRYPESDEHGLRMTSPYRPVTSPGRPTLLSLSRDVHSKYQKRVWEENTFSIASQWNVRCVPNEVRKIINKIQIAFTIRDLSMGGITGCSTLLFDPSLPVTKQYKTSMPLYIRRSRCCRELLAEKAVAYHDALATMGFTCGGPCHYCSTDALTDHWIQKLCNIGHVFKVSEWTFDFTECYSPDWDWMGNTAADIIGGIPIEGLLSHNFEERIIAPDAEKKQQLLARISQRMLGSRPAH